MDKFLKICRKLRGYILSPQVHMWKHIRSRIFTSTLPDKFSQLKDFESAVPPAFFDLSLEKYQQIFAEQSFRELKDYSTDAPTDSFDKIVHRIEQKKKEGKGRVIPMRNIRKAIAVAAVLLLAVAIIWIYRPASEQPNDLVTKSNSGNTLAPITAPSDTAANINKPNEPIAKREHGEKIKNKHWSSNKVIYSIPVKGLAQVDGYTIPIENNDILYSFASFTYTQDINWKKAGPKKITLGQYADINVSPYMSDLFADLFKTRRNGKATFRARRAKAKIKRWRKTDERIFDRKRAVKNPLDIIHLGDNVY